MGPTAPNVAQVTPRQIITCSTRPTCTAAPVAVSMSSAAPLPTNVTAFIEPNFGPAAVTAATAATAAATRSSRTSPPRPRRKQKINREQNRENATPVLPVEANNSFANGTARSSSSSGTASASAAAAAMVFPMQQQGRNMNLNSNRQQTAIPADRVSPSPAVYSLSRSIYSQVSHLISQHEQSPDQLARIFEDLQAFSSRSSHEAAEANNDEATPPDGAAGAWRYNTSNSQSQQAASLLDHLQSLDSPKVNGKFSFNTIRGGSGEAAYGGRRRGSDPQPPLGSLQPFQNALSEVMESSASNGNSSNHAMHSVVAVPKNIQRNQISRERNGRKGAGNPIHCDRKSKPRNMQQFGPAAAAVPTSPPPANSPANAAAAAETADFVSVPIKFHPRIYTVNRESATSNDVDGESEMAEADQDHSSPDRSADFLPQADFHTPDAPDSMTSAEDAQAARADEPAASAVVGVGGGDSCHEIPEAHAALRLLLHGEEAEAGLDRVPTRLAPSELSAQIAVEEADNGHNLVEEVLELSELPECVEPSIREPHRDKDE